MLLAYVHANKRINRVNLDVTELDLCVSSHVTCVIKISCASVQIS